MTQRPSRPTSEDLRRLRINLGLSQEELASRTGYTQRTIHRWENGEAAPRLAVIEALHQLSKNGSRMSLPGNDFRFIDLFAGIGGLRMGFEAAGGRCVFTSEWDKYCQVTYRTNFGEEHPIAGDIRAVPSELIPQHDVLLAGFPCQPFSIAGVSKKNALGRPHGFACEAQGTLFYEVSRILKHHRPKAFLLENVKNLVSHDKGNTFRVIRQVLQEELGYYIFPKVVDARAWVPQHRERIFIVGFRDLTPFDWNDLVRPSGPAPTLGSILHAEDETEAPEFPYTVESGKVNLKYRLTMHLWAYLKNYAAKHKAQGNGFGFGLFGPDDVARTLSARYYKDGSEILIKRGRGNPRRLTPRECARLMGFDASGRKPFTIPVSDTRAYKQFGNAVVVPVVQAIAQLMKPHILGHAEAKDQLMLHLSARSA
jgi:DNA (cytosine-5)-methyltransferase 1